MLCSWEREIKKTDPYSHFHDTICVCVCMCACMCVLWGGRWTTNRSQTHSNTSLGSGKGDDIHGTELGLKAGRHSKGSSRPTCLRRCPWKNSAEEASSHSRGYGRGLQHSMGSLLPTSPILHTMLFLRVVIC